MVMLRLALLGGADEYVRPYICSSLIDDLIPHPYPV